MTLSVTLFSAALLTVSHGFMPSGPAYLTNQQPSPNRRVSAIRSTRFNRRHGLLHVSTPGLLIGPKSSPAPLGTGFQSLGMPRVHRYNISPEVEEWAMWFQARDDEIEDQVVKLSTGRIYHATSANGLLWKISEGMGTKSSSFDCNTEEWWGFDTAHVGVGDVRLAQSDKVQTAAGIHMLYYFGGSYEERPAGDFYATLEGSSSSKEEDDADAEAPTLTGMEVRIGVAISQDGINWSRVEGEHASGAVLDVGKEGEFDHLMVGWPQVVDYRGDSSFRMYYQTMMPDPELGGTRYAIGIAESADGFKWTKLGQLKLTNPEGGASEENAFDARGISRRHVVKLENGDDTYYMFYEGISAAGRHAIGLATSTNGIQWERANGGQPVLEPSASGSGQWDAKAVGSPHIVAMPNGGLRMYYAGVTEGTGECSIGCADGHVDDLSKWTRVDLTTMTQITQDLAKKEA
eukprot:CAMPEP_0185771412 /NCGR_PEP_ID=MMETSP1174-20130828/64288_1 /TAXON_ID=35687 /ORGANISM="Dictyocha speculum, Strain CCMP1381" /LENGTH=460 /DNA_ID=CAMNT_0028457281 /DNA_START=23 /DNA_END=1405 /DNA_ORIENTATION=-